MGKTYRQKKTPFQSRHVRFVCAHSFLGLDKIGAPNRIVRAGVLSWHDTLSIRERRAKVRVASF